jgi:hypothetical protein
MATALDHPELFPENTRESDNVCSVNYSERNKADSFRDGLSGAAAGQAGAGDKAVPSEHTPAVTVPRVCENPACRRSFAVPRRYARPGQARFCSRSCASVIKYRQTLGLRSQVGASNGNFKGWASRNKRAYVDRFRARYPEKARAHDAVRSALRTGRLTKPALCQECGEPPTEPLHAHHADYSKPLAVLFVCRDCHRKLDRLVRVG